MAKRSRSKSLSSEPLSDIPEDERVNDGVDEEEPEAVGRAGKDSETEDQDGEEDNDKAAADEEQENELQEDDAGANELKLQNRKTATLKEMQRLKKGKTQEVLEAQNAAIDADMVESSIGSSSFCGDLNDNFESEDQSNGENNAGEPFIGRKKAKKLLNEEFNQFLISMKAQNELIKKMFQQTHDLLQKNYEVQLLKAQNKAKRVKLEEQRVENKILCINLDSIRDPMRREFIRNKQLKIIAKSANQPG